MNDEHKEILKSLREAAGMMSAAERAQLAFVISQLDEIVRRNGGIGVTALAVVGVKFSMEIGDSFIQDAVNAVNTAGTSKP